MNTKRLRYGEPPGPDEGLRDIWPGTRPAISRACCCPAWPAIQVIMPATAGRPHQTELLLCGHHYRVSRRALEDAGAIVTVLPGCPDDTLLSGLIPDPAPAPESAPAAG